MSSDGVPVVFRSFPCSGTSPKKTEFAFRGNVVNGRFEGGGKFKLDPGSDSTANTHDTCIETNKIMGSQIVNMTGTFKDGFPHGLVKFDALSSSNATIVVIGRFHMGYAHGLFRIWDENGKLKQVSTVIEGRLSGRCWHVQEGAIYFLDCRSRSEVFFLGESQDHSSDIPCIDSAQDTLTLMSGGEVFAAGWLMHNHGTIVRTKHVLVKGFESKGCMLWPTGWTQSERGESFKLAHTLAKGIRFYSEGYHPHCNDQSWDTSPSAAAQTRSWLRMFYAVGQNKDGLWQDSPADDDIPSPDSEIFFEQDFSYIKNKTFSGRLFGQQVEFLLVKGKLIEVTEGVFQLRGKFSLYFNHTDVRKDPTLGFEVKSLGGYADGQGLLQGAVFLSTNDVRYVDAKVKNSVLHGIYYLRGAKANLPFDKAYNIEDPLQIGYVSQNVGMLANFKNGRPHGNVWIGGVGSGYLYGKLNENRKFTGSNLAFLYPDFQTALVGEFRDRVMVSARHAEVTAQRCSADGIREVRFSEVDGPVFAYGPPTNISFGPGPEVPDQFEAKNVAILPRSSIPHSGEGVIALRDFKVNDTICFVSGVINRNMEEIVIYNNRYCMNESLSDDERRAGNKYTINSAYTKASIEIPLEMDAVGAYHPTVGPKLNCDFLERHCNTRFSDFEHPRYGMIVGVFAIKPIKKGQELFVDYGYPKAPFPYDHPWYHAAKEEYLKELAEKQAAEKAAAEKAYLEKKRKEAEKKKKAKCDENT